MFSGLIAKIGQKGFPVFFWENMFKVIFQGHLQPLNISIIKLQVKNRGNIHFTSFTYLYV